MGQKFIVYIHDIMNDSAFLEYEGLCQKYRFRPNYLKYFSLIKAMKSLVNLDRYIKNIVINDEPKPNCSIN